MRLPSYAAELVLVKGMNILRVNLKAMLHALDLQLGKPESESGQNSRHLPTVVFSFLVDLARVILIQNTDSPSLDTSTITAGSTLHQHHHNNHPRHQQQ